MSFERHRWGGVRDEHLEYVAFDLQQFRHAPKLTPTGDDVALGRRLLATLAAVPPTTSAAQAARALADLPGSNQDRAKFLDILGFIGVLASPGRASFLIAFTPYGERPVPPPRFVERAWPVCWWHGVDGIDWAVVSEVLPELSGP